MEQNSYVTTHSKQTQELTKEQVLLIRSLTPCREINTSGIKRTLEQNIFLP